MIAVAKTHLLVGRAGVVESRKPEDRLTPQVLDEIRQSPATPAPSSGTGASCRPTRRRCATSWPAGRLTMLGAFVTTRLIDPSFV